MTNVTTEFSAPASVLKGVTWRLVLTVSPPTSFEIYQGRTRHGSPPRPTSCHPTSTIAACHSTLVKQTVSAGDYPGFRLPRRLPSGTVICVSVQIFAAGAWSRANKPAAACWTAP